MVAIVDWTLKIQVKSILLHLWLKEKEQIWLKIL